MNRYTRLESQSDVGLGADEDGMRRFTRPCDRAELSARLEERSDLAPAATGDQVDVQIPEKK